MSGEITKEEKSSRKAIAWDEDFAEYYSKCAHISRSFDTAETREAYMTGAFKRFVTMYGVRP